MTKSKQVTNVKINNFELSADSLDDPITAAFDVVYDNQKLKGQTTLGSINQFLAADKLPFRLSFRQRRLALMSMQTVRSAMC